MQSLFAQTIAQFAPLRAFARMPSQDDHARNIRALFPKAHFDEKIASREMLFEIAWSFLSKGNGGYFRIGAYLHRTGGLPAITKKWRQEWFQRGIHYRDEKDPLTGLTLPAIACAGKLYIWYERCEMHRVDKDPRTGFILPTVINTVDDSYEWRQHGLRHRVRKDPITGKMLPAVICEDGRREVWFYGERPCFDEVVIGYDRPHLFVNES